LYVNVVRKIGQKLKKKKEYEAEIANIRFIYIQTSGYSLFLFEVQLLNHIMILIYHETSLQLHSRCQLTYIWIHDDYIYV
jgi:hypothetical protein